LAGFFVGEACDSKTGAEFAQGGREAVSSQAVS
jgi:hypothetical protein